MTPYLPVLLITPILLLLALGIVGFVLRYQKRLIAHQQHLRELQEARQRQVLEAALEAQEAERRRVARDLHDEVGAMLALVRLQVGRLAATAADIPNAADAGQKVKGQLDEVMGSVRRISHDLMPVMLEKFGLVPALESLKKAVPAGAGISMNLFYNKSQRITPRLELTLYRVVQELLNNTFKHSAATLIELQLDFRPDTLFLEYADNGKGFAYKALTEGEQTRAGLGMMNLQSRIELVNGQFEFFSEEGKGVKATILLPICYL